MSKALVIKGADFKTNAVAQVTYIIPKPCQSISITSYAEMIFADNGASVFTAVTVPAVCDTAVTWESSDSTIATVSDGTVTALKTGSVTITAKCGTKSASVNVDCVKLDLERGYLMTFDSTEHLVEQTAASRALAVPALFKVKQGQTLLVYTLGSDYTISCSFVTNDSGTYNKNIYKRGDFTPGDFTRATPRQNYSWSDERLHTISVGSNCDVLIFIFRAGNTAWTDSAVEEAMSKMTLRVTG